MSLDCDTKRNRVKS